MRAILSAFALLAPAALAGCVVSGTPVPVEGDLHALVGEWVGEYSSPETGRIGSIGFTLQAGRDSATGDVLMIPRDDELPYPSAVPRVEDPAHRQPRVLTITFVACEGREVTGRLDSYLDPDTGERVSTTFDGLLKGDTLGGTFVSYYQLSGRRVTGRWAMKRKHLQ